MLAEREAAFRARDNAIIFIPPSTTTTSPFLQSESSPPDYNQLCPHSTVVDDKSLVDAPPPNYEDVIKSSQKVDTK